MASGGGGEEKIVDFYTVLGLKKECSPTELRSAYKKLALRWHPDRCAASGNSDEESKKKFQAIQEAYSVLSNANKRFMYDIGVYENDDDDDDDNNEMGDFLGEMADLMSQTKVTNEGPGETFEDLQVLFEEMFHNDMRDFNINFQNSSSSCKSNKNMKSSSSNTSYSPSSSSYSSNNANNKRNCADMNTGRGNLDFGQEFRVQDFCLGAESGTEDPNSRGRGGSWKRRGNRKQKESSRHGVTSH